MRNVINIAISRRIAYLLKDFSVKINETFRSSLFKAVFDYVNLLSNVKSRSSDKDLEEIWFNFEINANNIFKKMKEVRKDFCSRRRQDAILLNKKLLSYDNERYIMMDIPISLYNIVYDLSEKYPHLYNRKHKTTIRDIVDRSILLFVSNNDKLLENKEYRNWRISLILEKEKIGKMEWNCIMERLSQKQKVIWKDEKIIEK